MASIALVYKQSEKELITKSWSDYHRFVNKTLPKALRTQALTALTSKFGLVGLVWFGRLGLVGLVW